MNRRCVSLGCVVALVGLLGVGCDDDNGDTDAGTTDGGATDSGTPMGGPAVGFGDSRSSLSPADFSCRGSATAPAETGEEVGFSPVVTDFQNGMPVEGIEVQFFRGNVPAADCSGGDCQGSTSTAAGEVMVMDNEGSWYAYRLVAGQGMVAGAPAEYLEVVQINEVAPAAGEAPELNAVSVATRTLIINVLGSSFEEGTATITGRLQDCGGENIANARLRVFDSSGQVELSFGRTGPREFYFASGLPGAAERSTNTGGLYGAANIPVPSDRVARVELWGSLTDGAAPEMLGCELVNVAPGSISIVNVGPTRSDGPTGCSM